MTGHEPAKRMTGKHIAKPSRPKGRPDDVRDRRDPHTEKALDQGLEETFPASDPVAISPGAT